MVVNPLDISIEVNASSKYPILAVALMLDCKFRKEYPLSLLRRVASALRSLAPYACHPLLQAPLSITSSPGNAGSAYQP